MLRIHDVWIALMPALVAGCGLGVNLHRAEETVSKSFTVKGPPRLVVETFNGAVDVTTLPENEVHARVTKRAGGSSAEEARENLKTIDVALSQEGDTIHVSARVADTQLFSNRGAEVELQVPAGATLEVQTTNGRVAGTGPTGPVTAHSSNGGIQVKGSKGRLRLETSNGAITVDGAGGRAELITSNGGITVTGARGVVDARTSNGRVHFAGRPVEGDYTLRTSNGGILVELPADAQFRLDARTSNGSIANDFPLRETEGSGREHVRGAVGDHPAASLQLHTSNAGIQIRRGKE